MFFEGFGASFPLIDPTLLRIYLQTGNGTMGLPTTTVPRHPISKSTHITRLEMVYSMTQHTNWTRHSLH